MIYRATTNGTLKSYRYNLNLTSNRKNDAQNTVLTGRNFNSFSEDPAMASRCFQLRRSFLRVNSQYSISQSVVSKYEVAWSTLDTVVSDVNNLKGDSALTSIITGASDTSGSGRNALGQELMQAAEGIVQAMNAKYGDNFVFAGADGLNVPFTLENGTLKYRGIDVNGETAADMDALNYLANNEKKFADIGLGLEETEDGELIESSAYNVALQGITYLGYGTDEQGDPKNIVNIISRMGQLLQNCDSDGNFKDGDQAEFERLFEKFTQSADHLSDMHVQMDARAAFLKSNQQLLESNSYTLQEQIVSLEDVDPAEAITSYSWAQYCYNAALKVGNSILSESLMDYLNT